jgi:hypothetical protein
VAPQLGGAAVSFGERQAFFAVPPTRILDTRFGPSPLPRGFKVQAGQTIDMRVGGFMVVPPNAGAVVLNVTVVNPTHESLLTIFPAGIARPTASSLNFVPGDIRANAVTVELGDDGEVSIYNDQGSVDVVVDVNGYYEDVNFDDRYDTEAESDAKDAAAIATPNHVGTDQVATNSLTGSDIADGSIGMSELTGNTPVRQLTLPNLSISGQTCVPVPVNLATSSSGRLLLPLAVAPGVAGSSALSASAVVLNSSGDATVAICNGFLPAFNATAPILEYQVL